jgi:hypothetical protein
MRSIVRLPIAILALSLLAACSGHPPDGEAVQVTFKGSRLHVENHSSDDVYYFMLPEPNSQSWVPASLPTNRIAAHDTLSLSTQDVEPGSRVQLNWWYRGDEIADGIYGPDRVRKIVVEIPPAKVRQRDEPLPPADDTTENEVSVEDVAVLTPHPVGTEVAIEIPSDPEGGYFLLEKSGSFRELTVITRRVAEGGEAFAAWRFDCAERRVQNLAVAGSLDELQSAIATTEPMSADSFSSESRVADIYRAVCR